MNRIKELRQSLNLTQKELAEKVGFNQTVIGKYERNDLEPNLETLKKLSNIFECSIDYIIGHSDDFGNVTIQQENPTTSTLPNDEKELLELYRKLPYESKQRLIARAEVMLEDISNKNKHGA